MKKLFTISLITLLIMQNAALASEKVLALSDEALSHFSNHNGRELYAYILENAYCDEENRFFKESPNHYEAFILDDVTMNEIHYKEIRYVSDETHSSISLSYQCQFGENANNSEVLTSTMNSYENNYDHIARTDNQKQLDRLRDRESINWQNKKEKLHITLYYYEGDMSKLEFPLIEVWIAKEK